MLLFLVYAGTGYIKLEVEYALLHTIWQITGNMQHVKIKTTDIHDMRVHGMCLMVIQNYLFTIHNSKYGIGIHI